MVGSVQSTLQGVGSWLTTGMLIMTHNFLKSLDWDRNRRYISCMLPYYFTITPGHSLTVIRAGSYRYVIIHLCVKKLSISPLYCHSLFPLLIETPSLDVIKGINRGLGLHTAQLTTTIFRSPLELPDGTSWWPPTNKAVIGSVMNMVSSWLSRERGETGPVPLPT